MPRERAFARFPPPCSHGLGGKDIHRRPQARDVVVATDDDEIASVCQQHGVRSVMTDQHHPSGSDRLAQACELLGLADQDIVVNVQGDEPLIDPELINQVAHLLHLRTDCAMSSAAHPISELQEFQNPNVVKTVLDAQGTALYFSRTVKLV